MATCRGCCSLLLCHLLVCLPVFAAQYQPNWDSLDKRPLPSWYDESKFGIFISWGLFSVPSFGNEWFWYRWKEGTPEYVEFMNKTYPPGFTYADFAPMFKAEMYDPDHWADVIQRSGAKYTVFITKHHSGWCNWPTKTSWNWNSMDTGPHRDLTGDFATAIRKTSVHLGLYFSQFEWFNPLFLQDQNNSFTTQVYPKEVSQPQLYELVNTYKPDVIFSDGDWAATDVYWNSTNFLAWLYNDSPVKDTVVVNDRWGNGCHCHHGGYFNCHDRYQPGKLQQHKWENAFTIDRKSWGYRREATISDYLTMDSLIKDFAITVSCGGNWLANIGPSADGRIPRIYEERLLQIGDWLSINGEAIYNTTPWQYQNDTLNSNVWYTYKPASKVVYGIMCQYPDNYTLTIGSVKADMSATKVTLLGYGELKWQYSAPKLTVTMPYLPLDSKLRWGWVLQFEGINPATPKTGLQPQWSDVRPQL